MSWGCCCAANQRYDGQLPNISMDEGDDKDPFADKNESELFFDLGQPKLSDKISGKSGAFNSTSAKNMRNANIFSAKEEALYMKSHSSIKSRRSSKNQSPNLRKSQLRRPEIGDYFAGAGSQAKNQLRKPNQNPVIKPISLE